MDINQYKIRINSFTAELNEPIDPSLRSLVSIEVDFYEESLRDLQNGEFDKVFKGKLVGSCIVKQGYKKPIISKSKRSQSQRLRTKLWTINSDDKFYDVILDKIINNAEEVVEFLKNR
jgi:hypothetical protein